MSRKITENKEDELLIAYPESVDDMTDHEKFEHYVKLKFLKTDADKFLALYPDFDVKYRDMLADLRQNRRLHAYFYGPVGTGKTFSAIIAVMLSLKQKWGLMQGQFQILDTVSFIFELQRNMGTDQYQEMIDQYKKCDNLIFDDFGMHKASDWNISIISDIVNYRYNHNFSTIYTSNHSLEDLVQFGYARNVSRIADICEGNIIEFTENLRNPDGVRSRKAS